MNTNEHFYLSQVTTPLVQIKVYNTYKKVEIISKVQHATM